MSNNTTNDGELMKKLNDKQRKQVLDYLELHKNDRKVKESDNIKIIHEGIRIIAGFVKLTEDERKKLLIHVWKELSKSDTNDYKEDYDITDVVQVLWEAGRIGFKIPKKSIISRIIPCFQGCSCAYNTKKNEIEVDVEVSPELKQPEKLIDQVLDQVEKEAIELKEQVIDHVEKEAIKAIDQAGEQVIEVGDQIKQDIDPVLDILNQVNKIADHVEQIKNNMDQ